MNGLCTDPGALREGNLNWRLKGKEIKLKWKVGICVYKKKKILYKMVIKFSSKDFSDVK